MGKRGAPHKLGTPDKQKVEPQDVESPKSSQASSKKARFSWWIEAMLQDSDVTLSRQCWGLMLLQLVLLLMLMLSLWLCGSVCSELCARVQSVGTIDFVALCAASLELACSPYVRL